MSASLVGSEMCIRDRRPPERALPLAPGEAQIPWESRAVVASGEHWWETVSYTHLTLPTICSV
eukprot:3734938-Alexandrium_andersonii.AAC.1